MYLMPGIPPVAYYFDRVLEALQAVRLREAGLQETEIHDALSAALAAAGIAHRREYTFGPRCRADLWIHGIAIEVKKQRPARPALLAQLRRYAEQPALGGLTSFSNAASTFRPRSRASASRLEPECPMGIAL